MQTLKGSCSEVIRRNIRTNWLTFLPLGCLVTFHMQRFMLDGRGLALDFWLFLRAKYFPNPINLALMKRDESSGVFLMSLVNV